MNTKYASPERLDKREIIKAFESIIKNHYFKTIVNSIYSIVAIINENRQIVYTNREFLNTLGLDNLDYILGKRPGEVFSCIHSTTEKYGCGTAEACRYCGAIQAVLGSQETNSVVQKEARISTKNQDGDLISYDMMITVSPLSYEGVKYSVLTLKDISFEKRKSILERLFFHDVINTAGGIAGILSIIKNIDKNEVKEFIDLAEKASQDLIDEITSYKQVTLAEKGDLVVNYTFLNSLDIVKETINKIIFNAVAKDKIIVMDQECENIDIISDRLLLSRILLNMLKNALEETKKGDFVKIGVNNLNGIIRFYIMNNSIMLEEVKQQVFQRSFSTKGGGRGFGTYSMKLLGEKYLKGKVGFISNETMKTIFFIEINNNQNVSIV